LAACGAFWCELGGEVLERLQTTRRRRRAPLREDYVAVGRRVGLDLERGLRLAEKARVAGEHVTEIGIHRRLGERLEVATRADALGEDEERIDDVAHAEAHERIE